MESGTSKVRLAEKKGRSLFGATLFGFVFTLLFSTAFLLIAALCAYETSDPSAWLAPLSYASLVMSSLVSGFSSGKFAGRRGMITGLCSGLLFAVLLFCVSFFSGMLSDRSLYGALLGYGMMVLLSALGGILGSHKREKKKHRRHS